MNDFELDLVVKVGVCVELLEVVVDELFGDLVVELLGMNELKSTRRSMKGTPR